MFRVRAPWQRLDAPANARSKRRHLSGWDHFSALAAPVLAIFLRLPEQFLTDHGRRAAAIYIVIAAITTTIAFAILRTGRSLTRYFSTVDAFAVVKTCAAAVAAASFIMFAMTRLDGVSRTVPVIHFLLLCAMLIGGRLVSRRSNALRGAAFSAEAVSSPENIILIGVTHAAWLYIQFVDEIGKGTRRIVAILDGRDKFRGRMLAGHTIVGAPEKLTDIIGDFEQHGVHISRIVLAKPSSELSDQAQQVLEDTAHDKQISIETLDQHIFGSPSQAPNPDRSVIAPVALPDNARKILERPYWRRKRFIESVLALGMYLALMPLMAILAGLVAINLGRPVLFWQQRIGRMKEIILIQKFRTLRTLLTESGAALDPEARNTSFGDFLRTSRLDELPQLLSIINGTMSLVGPRPLLPADQPSRAQLRLLVAPGLTGWSQVCGGNLLTQDEKGAMDDWYVENAGAWLDLKILFRTVRMMMQGESRDEAAITEALKGARKHGEKRDSKLRKSA